MRLRKVLAAAAVFLITLEVVLQIGALAMVTFVAPPAGAGPATGTRSVLCVGDSYTFGIGATSPAGSYPGQLATALAARGLAGVGVDNAGFPGQHSADLLSKLSGQLTPSTKVLCVLVGANDCWRRPARVDLAELARTQPPDPADGRFQWCWRTARLFQLITRFEANVWKQSGDRPAPTTATQAAPAGPTAEDRAFGYAALGKLGLPTGEDYVGRYEPDPTLPAAPNDEFGRRMQAGDFTPALALAEQSVRDFPDSPRALLLVATAATSSGQRDKALAAVDRLAQLCKSKPSAAATEALAEGYVTTGQPALAITTARQRIAEQPLSIVAWYSLQRAAFNLGRREDAEASMPETIRLLGRREPWRTATIARCLARFCTKDDPARAVDLFVAAHFIDGNAAGTRIEMQVASPTIARAQFEAAITALGSPERAPVRELAEVLDEAYSGKGAEAWGAVLREHLTAMHDLAKQRGVTMVILSYPFHQEPVECQQRDAAQALGAPFVRIRERFDRERKSKQRADLFVPDGHCNDGGYAIMAEMVAEVVAPLLTR